MTSSRKGFYALTGAAFIYATFGVIIRFLSPAFGDNFQVLARFFVAAAIISVFNIITGKASRLAGKTILRISALGIAFVSVVLLFTYSINNTKIANTVFLLYAGSLTSSFLIGTYIFKEKVTINKAAAIVLALFGIAMFANAFLALSIGVIAGLASGILDGIQNSLRKTLKGVDRNLVLQYSFAAGSAFAALVTFISREQMIKSISALPIIVIFFYAVLLLVMGNLLLYGFQHFDVNVGTVILSMEFLFAALLGLILFREVPTVKEMIGGGLIFVASILSGIDSKQLFTRLKRATI